MNNCEVSSALQCVSEFNIFAYEEPAAIAWILRKFLQFAREGRTVGAQYLIENCRYDGPLRKTSDRKYKFDNDFAAILGRRIRLTLPNYADCITVRRSRFDLPEVASSITPFDLDALGISA